MFLFDGAEQLQPVEPAALQPDVEKHQARAPRFYRRERVVAVARGARAIPFVLENSRYQLTNVALVIDDENVGTYGVLPIARDFTDFRHGFFGLAGHMRGGEAQPCPCASSAEHPFRQVVEFDASAVLFQDAADDREP